MSVIACILSVFFLLLNIFFKKRKSISPTVLFFALWSFVLFLSILNLYGIYKPSDEAYFLIILMLIFFEIGSLLGILIKNKSIKFLKKNFIENEDESKEVIEPRYKIFYILSFFIILFNIIDIFIIVKEALEGTPMWQIRNWSLQPFGSSNPILDRRTFIEDAFRSIVLTPFATIIHPIAAYYFFNAKDNKQRYKLLIISLIVLITSSIASGGGRLGFIYYFGCFLLAFFITYKNKEISKDLKKKYRKIIVAILIIGLLFVVLYTAIRTGIGDLIEEIYTYFALPPTLLSVWLPDIKNIECTYGMTTFFGLHSYAFRFLDTLGLEFLIPQVYDNAYTNILNAEKFKNIGSGIANAFVTPIYYFFVDGGYVFVCIASLVFGYIISAMYEKFERNMNVRIFTTYVIMMYGIFLTFARIQTIVPAYIISFVLTYFILRPVKKKKKENIEFIELVGGKNEK